MDATESARLQTLYLEDLLNRANDDRVRLQAEVDQLKALINSPRTDEFVAAVTLEAAHQIERWGTSHDEGKTPPDWFWLLGYLAGKALHASTAANNEKYLHHIISAAASCLNWWRHATGESLVMRPGIAAPKV